MGSHTFIAENTGTTVLLPPSTTTAAAHQAYVAPEAGSMGLNLRLVAKMANAADLTITLKSADDATGTNATDFAVVVPIYKDGVRQTDAKAFVVDDDAANVVVDFCVDPGLIPDGKFVGLHTAISNAANVVSTLAIENVATRAAE